MSDPSPVPTGNTYDKYGSTNPLARRLMAGFLAALDSVLPTDAPTRVLEVGVGEGEISGRLASRWPNTSFVGVDLRDNELASTWRGHGINGVFADAQRLPFRDGEFDLVLAMEVLEHVPSPTSMLAEMRRVAQRNVICSVPREPLWRGLNMARGAYLRDLGNTPGHIQHFSKRGFVELVGTNFDVQSVASPLPWTLIAATKR